MRFSNTSCSPLLTTLIVCSLLSLSTYVGSMASQVYFCLLSSSTITYVSYSDTWYSADSPNSRPSKNVETSTGINPNSYLVSMAFTEPRSITWIDSELSSPYLNIVCPHWYTWNDSGEQQWISSFLICYGYFKKYLSLIRYLSMISYSTNSSLIV